MTNPPSAGISLGDLPYAERLKSPINHLGLTFRDRQHLSHRMQEEF